MDIAVRSLWLVPRHDVVLVNIFGHRAFVYESLAVLYGRLWRKRVVAMVRGGWMEEFIERWPRWTRYVLSKPHLVLTPHGFLKDRLSALGLRVDGSIPNFIDVDNYDFRLRSHLAPRLLYLRGTHAIYNPEMTLKAFSLVQRNYPDACLTIAGRDAGTSEGCRKLARDLNLRNVSFVGLVPKSEIPKLAESHDIYIQTNRVENMPVSVIEMWASGLPVVATNVGGTRYLIRDGEDGILVPSDDHNAMAEACLRLLGNPELAMKLSSNGRARGEALTWEAVAPAWQEALFPSADYARHG